MTTPPLIPPSMACIPLLLADLLPADAGRHCPSADVTDWKAFFLRVDAEPLVSEACDTLLKLAQEQGDTDYAALDTEARHQVLELFRRRHLRLFSGFFTLAIQCYCLDPKVSAAFGQHSRPPFPQGETVAEGDLSLLEVVYERGPCYRQC